ncbi:MAG: SPOR domain-containing protein [Burkholderiales bacterium]|nr:SPOR domain-containing protein [Burkholderiales bacterium]
MSDTQEAQQLRRRARRRLVGAIALVLFLVIVPPMLMDLEPKPVTTDLTVEIPRPESSKLGSPPPVPPSRAIPAEKAAPPAVETRKAEEPKAAPEERKPAPAPKVAAAEERKAQEADRVAAILKGEVPAEAKHDTKPPGSGKAAAKNGAETFVVPLGAYSNADNAKQLQAKLARAGVKSFTEKVKTGSGGQTRVAAGPYASRVEAEAAREKLAALKDLGVVPGTVTTR